MKTTIFKTLFIAFVAFAISVSAQDSPQEEQEKQLTAEEMAAIRTESMTVELGLTPEQTERLMEVNLEFFKEKKAAKNRKASDHEFIGMYEIMDDSVKVILNQEQYTDWKNPPRGRGNNNGNGNGNNNGGSSDSNSGNGNNGNNGNGNNGNNKNN
ncbi:MAG: DUF4890 domain-containing protein [Dysgonamonadaceae bacterium]|nr:DUF4890 domain-containing protein [Dysgonamonadaceae bacterium]